MIFNTISENFPAAMSSAEHFTEFSDQFEGILAGITVRAHRADLKRYTALPHCIALHCTTLHCTALHCVRQRVSELFTLSVLTDAILLLLLLLLVLTIT